jgi:FAD/FMN-containing dehydrogenase
MAPINFSQHANGSFPDHVRVGLREIVGESGFIESASDLEAYVTEERGLFRGTCHCVVKPATTEHVARIVALCAEALVPIVTQGGNTGLCGGGVPDGGIVLSTERLNKIRATDSINRTLTVEAGVILSEVQAAADQADALFPLSLAAEGSCRIGGNLATNAGGINVVRYGNARDLVLGLEVVLADGQVWNGLRGLRKDNTGYDLKQIFLGSEGTLGIITAAVLKLFPRPRSEVVALAAVPTVDAAVELFHQTNTIAGESLSAFELVPRFAMELCVRNISGISDPFEASHAQYALIKLASPRATAALPEVIEEILGGAFESGLVEDAVIAASESQSNELWRIRESISEAQKHEGASIKNDVSVPVSSVPQFIENATAAVEAEMPGIRVCAFGHMGDGNIHFNLSQPSEWPREKFLDAWDPLQAIVTDVVADFGGSFSAEHGIGRLKKDLMRQRKPAIDLDLMRRLKHTFDPKGILNPGKVLPDNLD